MLALPKTDGQPLAGHTEPLTYEVHGAAVLKLAFRYEGNILQRVRNEVVHSFEPIVLYRAVSHEPVVRQHYNLGLEVEPDLSQRELPELMMTGGKSEPQNFLLRGE